MNQEPARDQALIDLAAFLRALVTSWSAVVLGLYLPRLALSPVQVGAVISAGLLGAALAALAVTLLDDRFGRRRVLVLLAVLGALGTAGVAAASAPAAIGLSALLGMVNGMGRDRGPALILEQAILPLTSSDAGRTRAFAWYNVFQDAGHALGAAAAGLTGLLERAPAVGSLGSHRLSLAAAALLLVAVALLYRKLSPAVEAPRDRERLPLSAETRRVLIRISALFALDSLGGGFLTTALLSYFFFQRFGVETGSIGLLFFAARLANALSHLAAARLARRIGLLNTMVFTHLPSSLLLVTVAFAPSFPVAAALFLLREGLVEMDVPTRQSYLMAVVAPRERTVASGVTHLVRLSGWALAPLFAGALMEGVSLHLPLLAGSGMKAAYDAALYFAFRRLKPPEERGPGDGKRTGREEKRP